MDASRILFFVGFFIILLLMGFVLRIIYRATHGGTIHTVIEVDEHLDKTYHKMDLGCVPSVGSTISYIGFTAVVIHVNYIKHKGMESFIPDIYIKRLDYEDSNNIIKTRYRRFIKGRDNRRSK